MARKFNGTTDWLQSASMLDLTGFHTLAVAFWLWIDSYANRDQYCVQFYDGTNLPGAFYFDPDWNFDPGSGNAWNVCVFPTSNSQLDYFTRPSAAGWHHFVIQMSMIGAANPIRSISVDNAPMSHAIFRQDQTAATFQKGFLNVMAAGGPIGNVAGRIEQLALWGSA